MRTESVGSVIDPSFDNRLPFLIHNHTRNVSGFGE